MLNIRQLCSLLACSTMLWMSVVPAVAAKSRKGDKYFREGQRAEPTREFDKALQQYELAIKEDPTDVRYQMSLRRVKFGAGAQHIDKGQKLREAGQLDEALLEFERAFSIDPSSPLAVQEIRRTKALIENARKQGAALALEERGLSPAQTSRRRSEERLGTIQSVPEPRPISRQVTSLKMNNQNVKVLSGTLGKLTGINVIWDPEFQQPTKNYDVDLTN